jgi:hypothetical protein
VIRTVVRAPNMNTVSERFVGSVRCELLDHVLLLDDEHLATLLHEYRRYFNENRPHQGIGQRVPTKPVLDIATCPSRSRSRACSVGFTSTTAEPRDPWRSCRTTSVASTGMGSQHRAPRDRRPDAATLTFAATARSRSRAH